MHMHVLVVHPPAPWAPRGVGRTQCAVRLYNSAHARHGHMRWSKLQKSDVRWSDVRVDARGRGSGARRHSASRLRSCFAARGPHWGSRSATMVALRPCRYSTALWQRSRQRRAPDVPEQRVTARHVCGARSGASADTAHRERSETDTYHYDNMSCSLRRSPPCALSSLLAGPTTSTCNHRSSLCSTAARAAPHVRGCKRR